MAWIELHQTLPTNKKTLRLKNILKIKTPQAIGHLCLLWLWALDNAEDGDISMFSADEIAEVAGWTGKKASTFVSALIESGFVDADMHIHNWNEYAGKLMDKRDVRREQDRIRQQARRDKLKKERDSHADVTRDESVNHAPIPYPTVPYSTVPENTVVAAVTRAEDSDTADTTEDSPEDPELAQVMTLYMDRICANPSRGSIDELISYTKMLTGPVVRHAIDIAVDDNKRSWSYVRGILRSYMAADIKTLDDVQRLEAEHEQQKAAQATSQKPRSKSYIPSAAEFEAPKASKEEQEKVLRALNNKIAKAAALAEKEEG